MKLAWLDSLKAIRSTMMSPSSLMIVFPCEKESFRRKQSFEESWRLPLSLLLPLLLPPPLVFRSLQLSHLLIFFALFFLRIWWPLILILNLLSCKKPWQILKLSAAARMVEKKEDDCSLLSVSRPAARKKEIEFYTMFEAFNGM